jgi:hypothetical protein
VHSNVPFICGNGAQRKPSGAGTGSNRFSWPNPRTCLHQSCGAHLTRPLGRQVSSALDVVELPILLSLELQLLF